jgi:hypothetical protein
MRVAFLHAMKKKKDFTALLAIPKCPVNMWSWFSSKISFTLASGTINLSFMSISSSFSFYQYRFIFVWTPPIVSASFLKFLLSLFLLSIISSLSLYLYRLIFFWSPLIVSASFLKFLLSLFLSSTLLRVLVLCSVSISPFGCLLHLFPLVFCYFIMTSLSPISWVLASSVPSVFSEGGKGCICANTASMPYPDASV